MFYYIGLLVVILAIAAAVVFGSIFLKAKFDNLNKALLGKAALKEMEEDFDRLCSEFNLMMGEMQAYERIREFINTLAPEEKALFAKFPITRERRQGLVKYMQTVRDTHALVNEEMRKHIGIIADPNRLPTDVMPEHIYLCIKRLSEFEKNFTNQMKG